MENDDVPELLDKPATSRRRVLLLVIALVVAGAVITWFAFGAQLSTQPVDVTHGVELVQPTDRTSKGR